MQFRYLDSGSNTASLNMGIDEALLNSVANNVSLPTLRLYSWKPKAVSIGYFQSLEEEINLDACKNLNVDYVRRITGGGAVFHDNELTYSIVIPQDNPLYKKSILESYTLLCDGIVQGLKEFGIKGKFSPINDVLAEGKKVSGNAQTRKMGCILQHGTIILDVDVDTMFEILKVPQEKLKGKLIDDVKARVTSLKHLLGREITQEEAILNFKKGFEKALDITLMPDTITKDELILAQKFEQEKFLKNEWNNKR